MRTQTEQAGPDTKPFRRVFELTDLALERYNNRPRRRGSERTELPLNRPSEARRAAARATLIRTIGPLQPERVEHPLAKYARPAVPPVIAYDGVPVDAERYHMNLLTYLEACHGAHYGAVIAPQTIWFTVLTELSSHIKKNAEHYRHLFTRSSEKVKIIVNGVSPYHFNAPAFIERLRNLVPVKGGVDVFLPEFTNTTPAGRIAMMAAFCDAVSPFYDYGMKLCGIPRVRVEGTPDDWASMSHALKLAGEMFDRLPEDYTDRVGDIIESIEASLEKDEEKSDRDHHFWNDMFYAIRCGSGSEETLHGWATKLFLEQPRLAKRDNFPTQVAEVSYEWMPTKENFTAYYGLFSSHYEEGDGDFLVPEFSHVVHASDEDKISKAKEDFVESLKSHVEGGLTGPRGTQVTDIARAEGLLTGHWSSQEDSVTQWVYGSRENIEAAAAKHGLSVSWR